VRKYDTIFLKRRGQTTHGQIHEEEEEEDDDDDDEYVRFLLVKLPLNAERQR
jgi:hypothetical protein